MQCDFVTLLAIQRDLMALPRDQSRFRAYLRELTGDGDDLELPLSHFNPMGKAHVGAQVEALIAADVETLLTRECAQLSGELAALPGMFRFAAVVIDDAQGAWTDRAFTEMGLRFECGGEFVRGWAVVPCWTSEPVDAEAMRRTCREAAYTAAWLSRHDPAPTLGDMLTLAGFAAVFAGQPPPPEAQEALEQVAKVIGPHRGSPYLPIQLPCLFGDAAALRVGHVPLGLPDRAGFHLAHAEALVSGNDPLETLIATFHPASHPRGH